MSNASRRLADLRGVPRWGEAEGALAVRGWRESGLGLEEFAAREGLHPVRVTRWARRLAGVPAPAALPELVPVEIRPSRAAPAAGAALAEVVLGSRLLRVPADVPAALLVELVRAIEGA
jgi:hypothetical protein